MRFFACTEHSCNTAVMNLLSVSGIKTYTSPWRLSPAPRQKHAVPRVGRPQGARGRHWEWQPRPRKPEGSAGRHHLLGATASAAILCVAPAPTARNPLRSRRLRLSTRFLGEADALFCLRTVWSRLRPAPLATSRQRRPSHCGSATSPSPSLPACQSLNACSGVAARGDWLFDPGGRKRDI